MVHENICKQCQAEFVIDDADLDFYKKISPTYSGKTFEIPLPTLCPDCRNQRRQSYRNEINFYKRKCDLTGKEIISIYRPDAPVVVYNTRDWWSDKWDPMKFERDLDPARSFFEQYDELARKTPRPAILSFFSENSDYTNHAGYNKNSYMCVNTGYCEDMSYCTNYVIYCKDCVDCLAIQKCEQCYECVNTNESTFSQYLIDCNNCNECQFCFDCQSCADCFGCYNLRHKQYHIFNQPYSKENYTKKLKEIAPKTYDEFQKAHAEFLKLKKEKAIHRDLYLINTENSTGDRQWNNKNVRDSFQIFASQDCRYCYDAGEMNDSYDVTEPLKGNFHYESHASNDGYNVLFASKCYEDDHLTYCQYCWNTKDCFGCFGLRHKQYCILNKQYSKEDYVELVRQIIEKMIERGEWGELYPAENSPFAYNKTLAFEYYPLTEEEAKKRNYKWEKDDKKEFLKQTYEIPDDIKDVDESICSQVLSCAKTGKNFKILPHELVYYKKMGLPIPRLHPDTRHFERMAKRTPRIFYQRQCMCVEPGHGHKGSCPNEFETTYAPDRPERVYCETCYQRVLSRQI